MNFTWRGSSRTFSKILACSHPRTLHKRLASNPATSSIFSDPTLLSLETDDSFFPFSWVLPIFGLSVALLLQSTSLPVAGSGNPDSADAKPIVHFTDVALKAGLTAPIIFGGENTKKYIIETTGTGVSPSSITTMTAGRIFSL